ncbi:MAG: metallophosphoesterase [Euryarchaeota archaeon]|nr:metallophosphoesterase [Euryarchaeota archaeon]
MKFEDIYGAKIIDLALNIGDNLIISDLHFGYEEALNADGIMVPKFQYEKIIGRLDDIFSTVDPNTIIINGDLKHQFGKISRQEWKEAISFIDFLREHVEKIILIKGNHDNFTKFIAKKIDLKVYDSFSHEKFLILHGHKIPKNYAEIKEDTLIIGHEHPCIGLRSGERLEKIKCFLKGKFADKNLIVMPSFNFVTEGSDILQEKPLSPFLKNPSLYDFEIFGVENFEILYFGKLKQLMASREQFL